MGVYNAKSLTAGQNKSPQANGRLQEVTGTHSRAGLVPARRQQQWWKHTTTNLSPCQPCTQGYAQRQCLYQPGPAPITWAQLDKNSTALNPPASPLQSHPTISLLQIQAQTPTTVLQVRTVLSSHWQEHNRHPLTAPSLREIPDKSSHSYL